LPHRVIVFRNKNANHAPSRPLLFVRSR
jgi:hypothetical protein